METQSPDEKPTIDYHSTVDTSRPFRSVKEAVAILGERLLTGEMCSPKPFIFPKQESSTTTSLKFSPSPNYEEPSWTTSTPPKQASTTSTPPKQANKGHHADEYTVVDTLKKLESELEETKIELKLLKERGSETEVALASLNAELHKNMSKMAKAEAAAAAKAVATRSAAGFGGNGGEGGLSTKREERRDMIVRVESSPTLAQILSIGEKEGLFAGKKERKMMKKKPVIPLVTDLFSRKKGSSTDPQYPLYSSSYIN